MEFVMEWNGMGGMHATQDFLVYLVLVPCRTVAWLRLFAIVPVAQQPLNEGTNPIGHR